VIFGVPCSLSFGTGMVERDGSGHDGGSLSRRASRHAPTSGAHRRSHRRRNVLGALITIAIVVAVVTIAIYSTQQAAQRATLEKVRLGIEEVQLQEATSTSIDVNVRLVMVNPNRDAVAFDRMTFDLYGNGSLVGNTEYGQKLDVPPFSSTFIVVPMGISWSGGNEALSSSMIQGNMTWEVKGTAYFDTSWGTVSVPVDVTSP